MEQEQNYTLLVEVYTDVNLWDSNLEIYFKKFTPRYLE